MFKVYVQNNLCGYFHINRDEAPIVVIEGNSEKEIDLKAKELLKIEDKCSFLEEDRWYFDFRVQKGEWREKVYFNEMLKEVAYHKIDGGVIHYKYNHELQGIECKRFSECEDLEVIEYENC